MPSWSYVAAALALAGAITLALRAVPFAALRPLRESEFVGRMGVWMPTGILGILAASTFVASAGAGSGRTWAGLVAVGVTVAVHLLAGRRTLLSVGAGTATFVALLAVS